MTAFHGQRPAWLPWIPLLFVSALVLAANLFIIVAVAELSFMDDELFGAVLFSFLGAYQAESILLGIWLVWGTEPLRQRVPVCLLLLYLSWLSWPVGMLMAHQRSEPEIAALLAAILFVTFLMCAAASWVCRQIWPELRIRSLRPQSMSERQFSLSSIMVWMLLISVALAASRLVPGLTGTTSTSAGAPGLGLLTMLAMLFAVYGAIVGVVAAAMVLPWQLRVHAVAISFVVCASGPVTLGPVLMVLVGAPPPDWRFFGALFCYTAGTYLTTAAALSVARGMGYRLMGDYPVLEQPTVIDTVLTPRPFRREDLAADWDDPAPTNPRP